MKTVILDANTLGDDLDLSIFNDFGEVDIYGFTAENEVVDRIRDAEIIIVNKVILNESNLKFAPRLRLICLTATGMNNIDLEYAAKHNIEVKNVKGYCTKTVAQHTFALLFYIYEKLAYYDKYVKSGAYVEDKLFTHFDRKFEELDGKVWGIIGMGNIGKEVAKIAEVFGCTVIYYSTSGANNFDLYKRVELEELLEKSDIVSIHSPLTPKTIDLIDYQALAHMKRSAVIINVGRGKIVKEKDLVKALNENLIAGAALDVLEQEPMSKNSPLLEIQDSTKLIVTPHIAWASVEARNRVIKEVYKNIKDYIQ